MPDFPDPSDNQDYTEENDDVKHQASKPPSVAGEEDISGDTPSESPDIDEELGKVGLPSDEDGPKPLGSDEEIA